MTSGHPNSLGPGGQQRGESPVFKWDTQPLRELIRYIVERHHSWLRTELPTIGQLIHRTIWGEVRERPENSREIERLFGRFKREIEDHLKKEEVVLFPMIERLEATSATAAPPEHYSFGSIANPIQFMMQDHELANGLLAKMKDLATQTGAGEPLSPARQAIFERLGAIEADLAIHSRLEDEILFPRAIHLETFGTTRGQ